MDKKKWTLLYMGLNILIIIFIGTLDPDIKNLGTMFHQVRIRWIMGAILCMSMFWFMDGLILKYSIKVVHKPKSWWQCLKVAIIGQYYNAITPFASGGQPAQIYYMGKAGIPGGLASSILIIKFLVYQIVLSLYCMGAFFLKGPYIYRQNSWVIWFSILGFVVNAGAIFLLYFLSSNKKIISRLVYKIIDILNKVRLVKDGDSTKAKLESHVAEFHKGLKLCQNNFKIVLSMAIMTGIQLIFYFSITFFIYRSLGLKEGNWISIVAVQSLLYLAVSFIPTPGSMGASETGFIIFFKLLFPSNLIFGSMLLWRLISYYLNILAGALVILGDGIRKIRSYDIAS